MAEILLVDDEENVREILALSLESRGHNVLPCPAPAAADKALDDKKFDVILTDLRMEGRDAGLEVVRMAASKQPEAKVLLLTAFASAETAVAAMREGAFDYLTKPVSGDELNEAVERALESVNVVQESGTSSAEDEVLIGSSVAMQRVRERLQRAAKRDFTVLVSGESGTGKELAARYVHKHSGRHAGPFVPVHCGAIPESLFESELFGYRKGAFTGADSDRAGLIESADGGTLFLDEIGEMPLSIQVKLLRALQERCIRRVGDEREKSVDVRVVAATNRDLAEEVRQGNFREDLFYRLNVVPVHMPALRQRREDIPVLVDALMRRWGGNMHISESCLKRLSQLPLLGNVRELENLLQRMIALSESDELDESLLDGLYPHADASSFSLEEMHKQGVDLDQLLEQVERQLLNEALTETGGNVTQAAKLLGITFRSIRYRLKKLDIQDPNK